MERCVERTISVFVFLQRAAVREKKATEQERDRENVYIEAKVVILI